MNREQTSVVQIFHTNDMHGRISTNDDDSISIGIDKIAKVVNLALVDNKNTFWFDAGDFSHGTPRMTMSDYDRLVETLNITPLNAICTGNHDYNVSMEYLYKLSKDLNAYVLSANTLDRKTSEPVLLPYMIWGVDPKQNDYLNKSGNSNDSTLDDIKIGVFGLTTPETAYKTNPKNVTGVEFADPCVTAKTTVDMLKNTCHVIIALTHLGLDNSSEFTSERLVREVPDIDLVIDGHSHTELRHGMKVGNTWIVQAGSHGHFLGHVIMEIDNVTKSVRNIEAELLEEDDVDEIIKSPNVFAAKKIKELDRITDAKLSKVLTNLDHDINGERTLVRCHEAELGDLVADALRVKTGSDIAVINGGTLRTGLPRGPVSLKDLTAVFPFENTVQVAEIKGSVIKDMLEHSVYAAPAAFGGFLHVSGMSFKYKSSAAYGFKVVDITIGSESIDYDRTYTIASADFLFVGGDDYNMLIDLPIIRQYGNIEYIVAQYLNKTQRTTLERVKVVL